MNTRSTGESSLGRLDEAEMFFKAALHEAKEGFGPRDPRVRWALNNLAEFYRSRKEYKKAEPLYLEAIEILEQSFGPGDIRVGTALHNLGHYYRIRGRLDHAQTCYEIEGRVMGPGHPGYANTMFLLAVVKLLGCCISVKSAKERKRCRSSCSRVH
uniref:Uncharacterized protein n=1 Tax=Avena sativa TaxID=4498 RepID=A0ACD5WY88_AVESA